MKLHNKVKEKHLSGLKTIGCFCELGGLAAAEALACSDMDYFIVDCEHGPFGVMEARECIAGAQLHGLTPFVRVPDHSRTSILKNLDIGAAGLIIPAIDSVEQVNEIVRHGKYAPLGNRGFSATRRDGWGYESDPLLSMADSLALHNQETMLIPQCETRGCLEHIEEIAGIDGVDGIFVGPFDLSIALGIPGQIDSPVLVNAITRVLKACKDHNKHSFIFTKSKQLARKYYNMGFDSVTYNMDVNILVDAIQKDIHEILQ